MPATRIQKLNSSNNVQWLCCSTLENKLSRIKAYPKGTKRNHHSTCLGMPPVTSPVLINEGITPVAYDALSRTSWNCSWIHPPKNRPVMAHYSYKSITYRVSRVPQQTTSDTQFVFTIEKTFTKGKLTYGAGSILAPISHPSPYTQRNPRSKSFLMAQYNCCKKIYLCTWTRQCVLFIWIYTDQQTSLMGMMRSACITWHKFAPDTRVLKETLCTSRIQRTT